MSRLREHAGGCTAKFSHGIDLCQDFRPHRYAPPIASKPFGCFYRLPPSWLRHATSLPEGGFLVWKSHVNRQFPWVAGVGEGLAPPESPRAMPGRQRAGQATAPTTAPQGVRQKLSAAGTPLLQDRPGRGNRPAIGLREVFGLVEAGGLFPLTWAGTSGTLMVDSCPVGITHFVIWE